MTEPPESNPTGCPGCQRSVEPTWANCRHCGKRLKPGDELVTRTFVWLAILFGFAMGQVAIAQYNSTAATAYGVLLGLPLTYAFSKAIWFRLLGTPLSWNQLSDSAVRAVIFTFIFVVVVPMVIGLALLIFAFAVCSGALRF